MSRIYLDPTALLLDHPAAGQPDDQLAPGVPEAVTRLLDTGCEVVVLGESLAVTEPALPSGLGHASALPDRLESDDWYLTAEPHPAFGRPAGGTTVLVGPRRPAGALPPPRFDLEVRDLASAAMEILTRQAMA